MHTGRHTYRQTYIQTGQVRAGQGGAGQDRTGQGRAGQDWHPGKKINHVQAYTHTYIHIATCKRGYIESARQRGHT